MAFKKARAEQAALKIGIYGPPGSGKTFTSLLIAEGLARHYGKRVAYVDTEHGTDFYAKAVPNRQHHPEAFDFDALYTRALTEVLKSCRELGPEYGVVVIDSITHLWEATIAAYRGPKTRAGTIPMHAWGGIKKPYKDLMQWMLNCPQHVLILGRQANEWADDAETGEKVSAGVKMKAEGETAYEPHILLRMEAVKPRGRDGKTALKNAVAVPVAFAEKDRTGILQGRSIEYPTFETIAAPILGILGETQAQVQGEDEAASQDADALAKQDRDRHVQSNTLAKVLFAEMALATQAEDPKAVLNAIGERIRVAKAANRLSKWDLGQLRGAYEAAVDGKDFPGYRPEGGDAE